MALIALLLALAACAPVPTPTSAPLVYNPQAWSRADRAVIAIPGALTSIRVMTPALQFAAPDRAIAFYRLPGFDGRPESDFVNLSFAASHIADQVLARGFAQVDFIGHSTGSAIALEAAKEIKRRAPDTRIRVAAISTALPAPQPVLAGIRGALGTLAAAGRTGSTNPRTVWLEYYRTLAYGAEVEAKPETAQAADDLVAVNDERISLPTGGLGRRHTRALRRWTNPEPEALGDTEVVLYHGAVDPVFPPRTVERFAAKLPKADVRLIPDHGHVLMLTYPQVWGEIAEQLRD